MKSSTSPPGPKRNYLRRFLILFRRRPLEFLQEAAKKYGDVVYLNAGKHNVFLLNHPEYIKDVLVTHQNNFTKGRGLEVAKRFLGEGLLTSEGDFHTRQRRLSQPAFHQDRIAEYAKVMVEYTKKRQNQWEDGETFEITQEMRSLTLAIVAKTLFDADIESESKDVGDALSSLMNIFDKTLNLPFLNFFEKIPFLPMNRKFKEARNKLDGIVYRMIQDHRAGGKDRGDLLSMLLMSKDMELDGGVMSDEQLRDEVMTLFIAGHETTANALSWTWYLLSQHPAVYQKLQTELDNVLKGKFPTITDVEKLSFTRMVFSESMRIYPPAWVIGRRPMNDYPVGNYVLPAKSFILLSQYVMHHDERYYPEPFEFKPERWTLEEIEKRPKFSYFPFGGGGRQCIGESFAWMEGILVIACIAQNWQFDLVPGKTVEPYPVITLRPKTGIKMIPKRRKA
jgi:cytochrome P450